MPDGFILTLVIVITLMLSNLSMLIYIWVLSVKLLRHISEHHPQLWKEMDKPHYGVIDKRSYEKKDINYLLYRGNAIPVWDSKLFILKQSNLNDTKARKWLKRYRTVSIIFFIWIPLSIPLFIFAISLSASP